MKRTFLSSAIAAVMIATGLAGTCFTSGQASAQQPMGSPMGPAVQNPGIIALVDVNYIFKKDLRLKAQLTDLQTDAAKVQKDFEQQLQRLQEQGAQLQQMKPGTPDYTRLEESLVSTKAMIQGQVALKRKEFVQREAHLYYNAYREIQDEVAYFCQARGISVVLNFNGDAIHDENADDIARGISNKVVFYNKSLDITPQILPRFIKDPTPPGTPTASGVNNMGVFPPH